MRYAMVVLHGFGSSAWLDCGAKGLALGFLVVDSKHPPKSY